MQKVTTQEMIVLLNEIGEQAVVAMVERGGSEERDPIMEMLARKVQIINAIAERVQEMTAVEYFETRREMYVQKEPDAITATLEEARNPRLAVEIVKRWEGDQHD